MNRPSREDWREIGYRFRSGRPWSSPGNGNDEVTGSGQGTERRRRRARPGAASLLLPFTAFVVALSLIVQLVAVPYHQALAAPGFTDAGTARIAAELKATFGDAAALCVEVDGKGAPLPPAGHCDDQCPLCRFAAQASALVAPELPALPVRLDAASETLGAASEPGVLPFRLENRNRARGPPLTV
jgi:hypothetical protein